MDSQCMCSEMIRVYQLWNGADHQELIAILEEISSSGACIQLESPVAEAAMLRLVCSGCSSQCEFRGRVTECRHREGLGYFVQVDFEPESEWSTARYRPAHLLDPATLDVEYVPAGCSRCNGKDCRVQIMACVASMECSLKQQVTEVGREIANLCGGMDEAAASGCFEHLLHIPAECILFQEFWAVYESERRSVERCAAPAGDVLRRLTNVRQLVARIPEEVLEY